VRHALILDPTTGGLRDGDRRLCGEYLAVPVTSHVPSGGVFNPRFGM